MKNLSRYKKFIIVLMIVTLLQMCSFNTIVSLSAESTQEEKIQTSNTSEKNEIATYSATQAIKNGTYVIRSAINRDYALDVACASKDDCANVLLYKYGGYKHEQFKVTHLGSNYYSIIATHSNKSLDVTASGKANGTNVEQYKLNNPSSKNQRWRIQKNSDGTYSMTSESNGLLVDVADGKASNNVNIQMYEGNGTAAQRFIFDPVEDTTSKKPRTISDGTYVIKSAIDNKYSVSVEGASMNDGANVSLYKYEKNNHQKFKVKYSETDGYYTITALHTGKSLDVHSSGTTNGTNVEQYKLNSPSSKNQKWEIAKNSDGTYSLVSQCNGLYLDVNGGNATNGTNIQMYEGNGTSAQKFTFETPSVADSKVSTGNSGGETSSGKITGTRTVSDGTYQIEIGASRDFVLDVQDGSKDNCANIQVFQKQSAKRQRFKVTYLNDGTYSITADYSGKVLDVQGGGTTSGSNVAQYSKYNPLGENQKWIIKDAGGGYYNIISQKSGLYLDVNAGGAYNENNIQIWEGHGGTSQKFRFVSPKDDISAINASKYPGYKEKITALMNAHPGWNFELLYTGLKYSDVIAGETAVHSRNLVPTSSRGDYICPRCGTKLYDSGWYCASATAVSYYMDPRNFLDDSNVYQFLNAKGYCGATAGIGRIQSIVNGTFLQNYASDVDNACRNKDVNPYYIVARLIQEQGRNGSTTARPMNGGNGHHYFNPFNIGATGNGSAQIIANALAYAMNHGWDTMQKALEGGIDFCKNNWIDNGQNTLYQNKFDINKSNGTALYEHQYMQNLMAAQSEGKMVRDMYASSGKIDSNLTFIIPMYDNMGEVSTSNEKPSTTSQSGPIDMQVTANGGLKIRESSNTNSAVLEIVSQGSIILSIKRGINGNWNQVITKSGRVGYMSGDYLKQVNDQTNCNYTARVKTNDGSGCKIRIGPSIRVDMITALSEGTQVTVINKGVYNNIDGYDWYRIKLSNGTQAFMPGKYLQ